MTSNEPISLQEFARRFGFKPGYARELKMSGRLVLADDGKRVLPLDSQRRIQETRDNPGPRPPQPEEASFADFAALARFKPGYVTELRTSGRLVLTEDGKRVRVAESLALIADTRDPAKAGVRARHAATRGAAAHPPTHAPAARPAADSDDGDDTGPPSFEPDSPFSRRRAKAQAEREEALARKALRDEQVELGQLLQRDQVLPMIAEVVTIFRTSLENLAATLSPQVAALDDEARCKVLLDTSFEHALEELSRKFAAIGRES